MYEERSLSTGADASAVAIIETALPGTGEQRHGVGIHVNISTAPILAVLSAARRFDANLLQH
ncbi:MAG: alpha-isopropylmalate synthase regulatory domain-containing protein [Lautropia sp.]|nr:alpha-isopropylmalate synthase regulatory domain-containing protein [Lautropia sp.]